MWSLEDRVLMIQPVLTVNDHPLRLLSDTDTAEKERGLFLNVLPLSFSQTLQLLISLCSVSRAVTRSVP